MSAPDPRRCSTGDPDKGGNCTACIEYRAMRAARKEMTR